MYFEYAKTKWAKKPQPMSFYIKVMSRFKNNFSLILTAVINQF